MKTPERKPETTMPHQYLSQFGRFSRRHWVVCAAVAVLLLGAGARALHKSHKRAKQHSIALRSDPSAAILEPLAAPQKNEVKGRIESIAIDGKTMPLTSGTIAVTVGSTVEIAGWVFDEIEGRSASERTLHFHGRTTQSNHSSQSTPVPRPDVVAHFKNTKASIDRGFKVRFIVAKEWSPDIFDIALHYRAGKEEQTEIFPVTLKVTSDSNGQVGTHPSDRSVESLHRLVSSPQSGVEGRIENVSVDGRAVTISSGTIPVAVGSTVEIAGWLFDEKGDSAPSEWTLYFLGRTTQSVHLSESKRMSRPDVAAYFKNSKAAMDSGFDVHFTVLKEWSPDNFDIALLYRAGKDDRAKGFPIVLKVESRGSGQP